MGPRSYRRGVESSFTGAGSIIHERAVTVNQLPGRRVWLIDGLHDRGRCDMIS